MTRWVTAWGEEFDNRADAEDAIFSDMSWDDYAKKMEYSVSWNRLFEWARNQPGFFEEFENEFAAAEQEFFDENCEMIEE